MLVKTSEDPKMADAKEMIQLMRQMLSEGMDRHIESFRAKEEENSRKHRESIEEQKRAEREDRETITKKLEQLRIEKSKARGKETLRLPQYDGTNLDIDDWQENVEAIAKFNGWDLPKLLKILPISLSVHAKCAFDSLLEEEKRTKEMLFSSMRKKLDPQSKQRNKELFMHAKRGKNESVIRFMDRLRMYIRRWGEDPMDVFATEMLKYKCLECLTHTDQKVVRAAMEGSENLDKIVKMADSLLSSDTSMIGMVGYGKDDFEVSGLGGDEYGIAELCESCEAAYENKLRSEPLPTCWNCGVEGHRYWECYYNTQSPWDQGARNNTDYDISYSHGNIENQGYGGTTASDTTLNQPEAQNIPTPGEAKHQGHGLLQITEGNENETSGDALTRPFSEGENPY